MRPGQLTCYLGAMASSPHRTTSPAPTPKTIVVTGAASGIGAAAAREAVRRGNRAAVCDINLDAARSVCSTLGPNAVPVELDVRSEESWKRCLQTVQERFEVIDVLVNNAGIIHTGFARDLTLHQHQDMMDVNYFGVVSGVLAILPIMREQGHGHIINVCSMTSFLPLTGYSTYGATKHAIRAFHHSLVLEERHGPIKFSIIHPPSVQTPMLEQEMADPTAVLAFAEKATAPEIIGRSIIDATGTYPIEVVFPSIGGRVHRLGDC
jgi:NADP-dependent 3-hydroxy acid dehydrogenase YdfG